MRLLHGELLQVSNKMEHPRPQDNLTTEISVWHGRHSGLSWRPFITLTDKGTINDHENRETHADEMRSAGCAAHSHGDSAEPSRLSYLEPVAESHYHKIQQPIRSRGGGTVATEMLDSRSRDAAEGGAGHVAADRPGVQRQKDIPRGAGAAAAGQGHTEIPTANLGTQARRMEEHVEDRLVNGH